MPGGQGPFPGLSVADNLQLAGWTRRGDKAGVAAAIERVFEIFPVLRDRHDEPSGNLSGGQQQMLALGMSFVMKPRLLMIDELSLGLAPAVVDQLLGIIADIRSQGTTIILVEQSVNLALEMAETAYFMEKGEIRFHGPTRELLERPDILRSVFLEGAATVHGHETGNGNGNGNGVTVTAAAAATVDAAAHELVAAGTRAVAEANGAAPHPNGGSAGPMLEVEGLTKEFGGVRALSHVTFEIGSADVVGFIGPNGAGKT